MLKPKLIKTFLSVSSVAPLAIVAACSQNSTSTENVNNLKFSANDLLKGNTNVNDGNYALVIGSRSNYEWNNKFYGENSPTDFENKNGFLGKFYTQNLSTITPKIEVFLHERKATTDLEDSDSFWSFLTSEYSTYRQTPAVFLFRTSGESTYTKWVFFDKTSLTENSFAIIVNNFYTGN